MVYNWVMSSYLSPMVNLSSRLQASTRQFKVKMIISGELHLHLSKPVQEKFRLIDQVTLKGSSIPIDIFCLDIDLGSLKMCHQKPKIRKLSEISEKKRSKGRAFTKDQSRKIQNIFDKLQKEELYQTAKKDLKSDDSKLVREFLENQEFGKAMSIFNGAFKIVWKRGYKLYKAGNFLTF